MTHEDAQAIVLALRAVALEIRAHGYQVRAAAVDVVHGVTAGVNVSAALHTAYNEAATRAIESSDTALRGAASFAEILT